MTSLNKEDESLADLCPVCGEAWSIGIDCKIYKHFMPSGEVLICNLRTGDKRRFARKDKKP
jgi:hypothetical protein